MAEYRSKYTGAEVDALLGKVESGEVGGKVTPDWNASKRESGFIKSRTHYVRGTRSIPFENWNKSIDENGDAIYSFFVGYDEYCGCIIRDTDYVIGEENYIFFETEWVSLSPAVLADIRLNIDIESSDTLLEIKLYKDGDGEDYLKTFINNTLFATGQSDFTARIAENFIPNTIARQESVDELREETTALWENLDHGTFPDLVAGDLAGRGESVPAEFGFRASGGKSIKDGRAYIKRIKGNSVVWNQYCQSAESRTHNGVTFTNNGDGSWTINGTAEGGTALVVISSLLKNKRHKWLITGLEGGSKTTYCAGDGRYILSYNGICDTSQESINETNISLRVVAGASVENLKVYPRIYDLTQMFGAGKEPTTIEEFYQRIPSGIDLNAYNEGQVIHCNTESIKSIGDNAWDEQWRQGYYIVGGSYNESPTQICSKNPIPVLPNESYCINQEQYYVWYYDREMRYIDYAVKFNKETFVTPSNAAYIHFNLEPPYGTTYKNDIMLTLVHSGWKQDTDAGYQPYWQDILPLPIIHKYFPQGMKSAGSAHDEIRYNKASGKWEKVEAIGIRAYQEGDADNAAYLTDGKVTCYPLAEPIVTELDEVDQNFRDYYNVADFGTEQSQSSVPSAAFSADIIYQFNAVDMIREHELEITELQSIIATMQAQLASLTSNNA